MKRFAHLGIKAHCVGEINEPAIKKDDLLIVGSGSGGSLFPLGIAKKARETVDCTIVHIQLTEQLVQTEKSSADRNQFRLPDNSWYELEFLP